MDDLIFKLYLEKLREKRRAENEASKGTDKIFFISYFILSAISMIIMIAGLFYIKLLKFALIPICLLMIAVLIFSHVSKTDAEILIENNKTDRELLIDILARSNVNNKQNIQYFYDNLQKKYDTKMEQISKNKDRIFSFFKIFIIPAFLAFFVQLAENEFTFRDIISIVIVCIFLVLLLIFIAFMIYNTYLDMVSRYYKNLKQYLSLLNDILHLEKFDESDVICNVCEKTD